MKQIRINSIADSSVFQIGDAKEVEPNADILAVQKEGGISSDKGFELDQYPIFHTTIQTVSDPEVVNGDHYHYRNNITVSTIDITALSTSSITQLGNNKNVYAFSRTKHIRILAPEDKEENNGIAEIRKTKELS
ncbi:spore germination protein GerPE [Gracilibacillus sp. HCP3S3_G5_2]|uniref:spore germination protein GerPE n=1 Tax=Gracilibacillus sp. HCP3S3_G5_2 TaxID=3438941 RepID=UPI003F89D868